ncbi:MAG: XrtA system polysaccharide deacetylase [Euryarchaeota archaeon]|nr:XrtA system polysaccharide deacetylase [Euryarchaeota archaeon]
MNVKADNIKSGVTNILTIDIEDWYMDTDISTWDSYEDRVVQSAQKILEILDETNTKATFFVVGYVAEHFPELIEDIKDGGHEMGTHGYSHTSIKKQTPAEFEEDLLKSVRILEDITKEKIRGHRACEFSIVEETSWALDILKKNGLKYDSSVFPVKTHLYGAQDAPLHPYHISSSNIKIGNPENDFLELPLSVYRIPIVHKNIPIAGGFYLRLFPYSFIKHAIRKINKMGQPVIFYIHPWEFDPKQPRIKELKWYHYYRLGSTERKFKKLLKDFNFSLIMETWGFK